MVFSDADGHLCCDACLAESSCGGFVVAGGMCYFKTVGTLEVNVPPPDTESPGIILFIKTDIVDAANAPPGMIYMRASCGHGINAETNPWTFHCDNYFKLNNGERLRLTVESSWRTSGEGDEWLSTILKDHCNAHGLYFQDPLHTSECKAYFYGYCGYRQEAQRDTPECDNIYEGYFYTNPIADFKRAGIRPGTYTIKPTISRTNDYADSSSNPSLVPIYTCSLTDWVVEGGTFSPANELVEVRSGHVTVIEYSVRAGYSPFNLDGYNGISAGDLVCRMHNWRVSHVPIEDLLGQGYTPLPDVRATSASQSLLASTKKTTGGYNVALASASSASIVVGVFVGVQGLLSVIFARKLRREDTEEPVNTPLTAK